MGNIPYPLLNVEDPHEFRRQVYELMRNLYEDKIGGADVGDVFGITGDVLTLNLDTNSGMQKSSGYLSVAAGNGVTKTADGVTIDLDGSSLTLSADGLKVNPAAVVTALTNSTGETGNDEVVDVGAVFNQTTLNQNFADLTDKIDAILTAIKNAGFMATS